MSARGRIIREAALRHTLDRAFRAAEEARNIDPVVATAANRKARELLAIVRATLDSVERELAEPPL